MKTNVLTLNRKNIFTTQDEVKPKIIKTSHEILKNKLLSPQDRVVYGSLSQWSSELISAIQLIDVYSENEINYDKIADIFNNAALILFCIGDVKSARELCYSQIQMFVSLGKKSGNSHLYQYVFMPWINLIRIDRLEGKFSDAMNKLNMLSATNNMKIKVADDSLATYLMADRAELDADAYLLIKNAVTFEFVKIYLETHQYAELIHYIERSIDNAAHENRSIFHEAMILALANTGRMNDANEWLRCVRPYSSLLGKNIFLLRDCEMRLKFNDDCHEELQYLAAFSLCELQSKFININEIMFAMQTANVMCESSGKDEAIKLLYFCLEAADKLNDEVLTAECMILLYQHLRGSEGGILIENLMIDHYVKTQYGFVRKQMLACFSELKLVECKHSHAVMTTLFEELLSFSTIFIR